MITITPPIPLADIDLDSPHVPANREHGRTLCDLVFLLEEQDGDTVATALVAAEPDAPSSADPVSEINRLILTHAPDHAFSGSVIFPAGEGNGEPPAPGALVLVGVDDSGYATCGWA